MFLNAIYTVPIPPGQFISPSSAQLKAPYDLDADLATSAIASEKYMIELYVR
jgi:hypothetical protein